ncbi:MAG: hypothetical protein VX100_02570 [Pseudomonadota bacterium]|nr:hypothetical protein [Pseudomonadota bacterium]
MLKLKSTARSEQTLTHFLESLENGNLAKIESIPDYSKSLLENLISQRIRKLQVLNEYNQSDSFKVKYQLLTALEYYTLYQKLIRTSALNINRVLTHAFS